MYSIGVIIFIWQIYLTEAYTTTGTEYDTKVGFLRVGPPTQQLNVNSSSYCLLTCTAANDCQSINSIKNQTNDDISCELFTFSVTHNESSMVIPASNSVYYEVRPGKAKDCTAAKLIYDSPSGVYSLTLFNVSTIKAFCDMDTNGGGWTLLQRRFDGSVDFYRDWNSYRHGFGDIYGEFWLGLDAAHELTNDENATLRFDLWDGDNHYFMEYYETKIADESDSYRLRFNGMSGTAGDAMVERSKNQKFTTKDNDNDNFSENCAKQCTGAWWYSECHRTNPNGKYGEKTRGKGINWVPITNYYHSLSKTEIKLKRNS